MSHTLDSMFPQVIVKNAFRVTKDAFKINSDSEDVFVLWVECYNAEDILNEEIPSAILVVADKECRVVHDFTVEKQAKLAAMSYRVRQIQDEYGIDNNVTYLPLIHKILERVWSGEWMGQFNEGRCIYINELADLLNLPMIDIWPVVDELVRERKADLLPSSFILVEPQSEDVLKSTQDMYGHKEYTSSDFGYWYCLSCKRSGDDYSNPAETLCVTDDN